MFIHDPSIASNSKYFLIQKNQELSMSLLPVMTVFFEIPLWVYVTEMRNLSHDRDVTKMTKIFLFSDLWERQ